MTTTDKDYYAILGVAPKADDEAIKKAYRKLAKRYHPDANPGNPSAAERFREIGEANAVLSDPAQRARYDRMRRLGAFGIRGGGQNADSGGRPDPEQRSGGFSFDDLGGLGGFGDLFSSIFDRGRKEQSNTDSGPARGANIEYTLEVPFMVAATGGKVPIAVPVREECAICKGSGGAPGTAWKKCEECRGSGSVSFGQGGFAVSRPCPACSGRGRIAEKICESCGGDGRLHQNRNIQVTVPAGVDTGSRVRLTGQGARGSAGGAPGDLVIAFKVAPHRFFRREGHDIHADVTINLAQATLGSRIRVRTISGRKVVLRIPPGTQPGTLFRIPGYGISREGKRGDQFVRVKVAIPESLKTDQTRKLEEFAEAADLRW